MGLTGGLGSGLTGGSCYTETINSDIDYLFLRMQLADPKKEWLTIIAYASLRM